MRGKGTKRLSGSSLLTNIKQRGKYMRKPILTDEKLSETLRRRDAEGLSFEQQAKAMGIPVSVINNGVRKHTVIDSYLGNPNTPLSGAGGFHPGTAIGMKGVREDSRTR